MNEHHIIPHTHCRRCKKVAFISDSGMNLCAECELQSYNRSHFHPLITNPEQARWFAIGYNEAIRDGRCDDGKDWVVQGVAWIVSCLLVVGICLLINYFAPTINQWFR